MHEAKMLYGLTTNNTSFCYKHIKRLIKSVSLYFFTHLKLESDAAFDICRILMSCKISVIESFPVSDAV